MNGCVTIIETVKNSYRAHGPIIFMRGYCRFYHYMPGENGIMIEIKISEIRGMEAFDVSNL